MKNYLPDDFYPKKSWYNNMLKFYSEKEGFSNYEDLKNPLKYIVKAVHNICFKYAKFPEQQVEFLKVISNPIVTSEKFDLEIIEKIKQGFQETGEASYVDIASSIKFLRATYNKDLNLAKKLYYKDKFISNFELEELCNNLSVIVKVHTLQVANLIEEEF